MTTPSRTVTTRVVLLCFAAVLISYLDRTNISIAAIAMQEQLGWDEATKGLVLSSFFIGYLLLQVVAGSLANRWGGRIVLGVAVLWWSLFTGLTPPAALTSFAMLIAARIALGLGEAAVFPGSINMIGRWVPAEQKSRAVALFSSGLSLGTVLALPLTAWIIRVWGWPMAFYAFGALGLVWGAAWFGLVPEGRGVAATDSGGQAVPWRRIFTTPAVWAIITCHFAHNWALYLLLAWLPSYFKTTFSMTLANAGWYASAPWLASFVMANVGGLAADRMMRAGRSTTFVRKALLCVAFFGSAIFLLALPLANTPTTAVVLMCCTTSALAFAIAGFGPNAFDIAPRYADVVWGITNTAGTLPGIVGVAITGYLVQRTGSYAAPFQVTAGLCVVGALTYLAIGSGERQID
ncbi:MAG: MFS transporter [Gemmatimonadetes bacterium]|nr:MFS transporter [Gemmatimonadota bacterium]